MSQPDPDPDVEPLPEPMAPAGLTGTLPRFPPSRPPSPPAERRPTQSPPSESGGPTDSEISSPASTSPPPAGAAGPGPQPAEVIDLKDLQAAVRQVVDIGFVGLGQGFGLLERRAKGLPATDVKWIPTTDERRFVAEPAGRIAKRHLRADVNALDTVDALLIGVGVGGFVLRRATGVEPLEDDQ